MTTPWWKTAVVYQIYPRSFADGNGDGVGDLRGIAERVDYLAWLGVDAIWLSPFFVSPMRDFGYDVADYCDVDPIFGSLADFDALVARCHAHDLRVLIDWVPAHSSSDHPWFAEARASRTSAKRDWYTWRDAKPDGSPPNNWRAAFAPIPAWTLDAATDQYYLHSFLPDQPDLNWANPAVRGAMHDVLRFWLDRGVDGFRADVVHNIAKPAGLPDLPENQKSVPPFIFNDQPQVHDYLREIRAVLDAYPGERMMVGEVSLATERLPAYYGNDDELHLSFNFPPLFAAWEAADWRRQVDRCHDAFAPIGAWPTWVLSNHDQKRHRTRFASDARARAAAVLLLTLRGTPFLYMGEELGLEDAVIPADRVVDPGGRDGCRAPLPWDGSPRHGWGANPWLPFPPAADERNAASLRDDPDSILHLYRAALAIRGSSPALQRGELEWLPAPEHVLAFRRFTDDDTRVVAISFGECETPWDGGAATVELSTEPGHPGGAFDGRLAPGAAVILRPA